MPTLKVMDRNGHISSINVERLIEVDGKAYEARDDFAERMAFIEGRVNALYELFTQQVEGD